MESAMLRSACLPMSCSKFSVSAYSLPAATQSGQNPRTLFSVMEWLNLGFAQSLPLGKSLHLYNFSEPSTLWLHFVYFVPGAALKHILLTKMSSTRQQTFRIVHLQYTVHYFELISGIKKRLWSYGGVKHVSTRSSFNVGKGVHMNHGQQSLFHPKLPKPKVWRNVAKRDTLTDEPVLPPDLRKRLRFPLIVYTSLGPTRHAIGNNVINSKSTLSN